MSFKSITTAISPRRILVWIWDRLVDFVFFGQILIYIPWVLFIACFDIPYIWKKLFGREMLDLCLLFHQYRTLNTIKINQDTFTELESLLPPEFEIPVANRMYDYLRLKNSLPIGSYHTAVDGFNWCRRFSRLPSFIRVPYLTYIYTCRFFALVKEATIDPV